MLSAFIDGDIDLSKKMCQVLFLYRHLYLLQSLLRGKNLAFSKSLCIFVTEIQADGLSHDLLHKKRRALW